MTMGSVLVEVAKERRRQDKKHGAIQAIPDGTGGFEREHARDMQVALTTYRMEKGTHTWLDVLKEEVLEAFAEKDRPALRVELVQVAAVAVKWIEQIDREMERSY